MNCPTSTQKGFTLIEILIGLVIGLIGMAAAISITTGVVRSNKDNLNAIRLNLELQGVMDIMTRDLLRAGYWSVSNGDSSDNIYMTSTNGIAFTTSQITFSYDADSSDDNTIIHPATDFFGYRRNFNNTLNAFEVQSRTTQAGDWQALTDARVINIATLNFRDESLDLDSNGTPDINYVGITLAGALTSDPTVRRTFTQWVRVRNGTDTTLP